MAEMHSTSTRVGLAWASWMALRSPSPQWIAEAPLRWPRMLIWG